MQKEKTSWGWGSLSGPNSRAAKFRGCPWTAAATSCSLPIWPIHTAMQPLQLLRNHTCNKKPVILKDASDNVVTSVADASTVWFDDESFARNTPTTFPKNSSDDTYTLDTLIFLVQNEHLDNSAYFKECRQRDIEHVSIVDRKKVLDYLTGKVDTQPTKQSSSTAGKRKRGSYATLLQVTKTMMV